MASLLLFLCLLAASPAIAQQDEPAAPTTLPPATELPVQGVTNGLPETEPIGQTNDLSGVEEALGAAAAAQTEAADSAQSDGQTAAGDAGQGKNRRGGNRALDGRQARKNRFAREQGRSRSSSGSGSRSASAANGTNSLDYAAFRIIAELNIFDPNRQPRLRPREPQAPPTEYFALVGTMTYDKGTFAFFSGSNSRYEKALKLADSIAGFKLAHITPDAVRLAAGTNQVELHMGMIMRREQAGPWHPSAVPSDSLPSLSAASTSSAESTASTGAAPSGAEAEILKRMMQRHERGE